MRPRNVAAACIPACAGSTSAAWRRAKWRAEPRGLQPRVRGDTRISNARAACAATHTRRSTDACPAIRSARVGAPGELLGLGLLAVLSAGLARRAPLLLKIRHGNHSQRAARIPAAASSSAQASQLAVSLQAQHDYASVVSTGVVQNASMHRVRTASGRMRSTTRCLASATHAR